MSEGMETRILAAAIACLERKGVAGTGIREIASEAGVNSAAMPLLLPQHETTCSRRPSLRLSTRRSHRCRQISSGSRHPGLDARAAFEHLIANYLFRAAQYPRLTFANLHDVLSEQRYTAPAVDSARPCSTCSPRS